MLCYMGIRFIMLNIRQNKNGFLLASYVLKIVLAVMGILILIYLIVSLYSMFSDKDKLEQAKANLDYIKTFEKPSAENNGKTIFPLLTPEGWILFTYHFETDGEVGCAGDCLCICPEEGWFSTQEEKCKGGGVCQEFAGISGAEDGIEVGVDFVLSYDGDDGAKYVIKKKE